MSSVRPMVNVYEDGVLVYRQMNDVEYAQYEDDLAAAAAAAAAPADAADRQAAAAQLVDAQLAAVPVAKTEIEPILQSLLGEAAAAIPFFEKYALDPSMTAQQWVDFQAIPWDATSAQTDAWTADGTATSWALSGTLDQDQAFTLTVDSASATVAVAASPTGATTDYVLVQQMDGTWLLECGTASAPAASAALSLAYTKVEAISKDRILYDCARSLAAVMRYLTGDLPTS